MARKGGMAKGGKAAVERAGQRMVSNYAHYAWPAIIWAVMWVLCLGAHYLLTIFFQDYLPYVVGFLALISIGITVAVWVMAKNRRSRTAWDVPFVVTSTAVLGQWFWISMISSPLAPPSLVTYLFAGFPAVLVWMIRIHMDQRDRAAEGAGWATSRGTAADQFLAQVGGHAGVRTQIEAANENHVDVLVDTSESDTDLASLAHTADRLAAAAKLPEGAVRFAPTGTAGMYQWRTVLKDFLNDPLPWPGPSSSDGTVTPFDPYVLGKYQDGVPLVRHIASPAGARHLLVTGMSGSGKGNGSRLEAMEHATRAGNTNYVQAASVVIDLRKGIQTFGPLARILHWLIDDLPTARAFLYRLERVTTRARFDYLAAKGLDAWEPNCGLTFITVHVEEASDLDIDNDKAVALARTLRSAGIRLVWSLQVAQHTQIDVNLRRQLGEAAVYGVNDDFDADALPDELQMLGGEHPSAWRDEHPGRHYLITAGTDKARKLTIARDFATNANECRAFADAWGPFSGPEARDIDDTTRTSLAELWARRRMPVDLVASVTARALGTPERPRETVQVVRPAAAPAPASNGGGMVIDQTDAHQNDDEDRADNDEAPIERATEEELREMGLETPDPAADVRVVDSDLDKAIGKVDPRDDMLIGDSTMIGDPNYEPTEEDTARIRAAVAAKIDSLEAAGVQYLGPPDLAEWIGPKGPNTRSRAWMRKELERLQTAGRVTYSADLKKFYINADPNKITASV